MSEVSRFYGIVIRMFHREHMPPHFHAVYGEFEALVSIDSLAVIKGNLPPRVLGLVIEWATIHQKELIDNWYNAINFQNLNRIEPLK